MDAAATLKIVGQVAGVGGLALGVLLLIFRDVIRKNIFPNLAQVQAYRLIRLIVVLTFAVALTGVAAWAYVQRQQSLIIVPPFPASSPQPAIDRYLAAIDGNKFDDAYSQLSAVARSRMQIGLMRSSYETVRLPLGGVVKRQVLGLTPYERGQDGTPGPFLNVVMRTAFERGAYAELMTLQAEDGVWHVAGHLIVPCQPPTCEPEKE